MKLKNNENELVQLKKSLTDFGLSPTEWTITEQNKNEFNIENLETPDFCFAGKTEFKKGQKVWQYIYLKSV